MQVSLPTQCKTLRLAIIPSLASTVTPAIVAAFATHLPTTVLRIIDARTELARDLIESDRADIAIHLVSLSNPTDEPLAWENLHWITRLEPDAVKGPVPFREVAAARLILPSAENPLRRYLQSVAQEMGVQLNIAMEVDGPDPRKQAVIAGLGTTVFGNSFGRQRRPRSTPGRSVDHRSFAPAADRHGSPQGLRPGPSPGDPCHPDECPVSLIRFADGAVANPAVWVATPGDYATLSNVYHLSDGTLTLAAGSSASPVPARSASQSRPLKEGRWPRAATSPPYTIRPFVRHWCIGHWCIGGPCRRLP